MESDCVLALDVGTSSVRAALYTTAGEAVPGAAARLAHQVAYLPDGGVESRAEILLDCVRKAVEQCLVGRPGAVAAVGISCFWHSLLGLDGRLQPVTPVLMWPDTRSAEDVAALLQQVDGEAVRRRTGCRLHPSYPPAKLHWVARCRPQWWAAARLWVSFGDYLWWWLTGELAASVSMASASGLFDQAAGVWDPELVGLLGLRPAQLPAVVDLRDGAAPCRATLGPALQGIPVLPPVGDGACNNVGSGATGATRLSVMLGTSAASRVLRRGGPWAIPPALWQYRLDRQRGLVGGALSNAGNLFQWLTERLVLPPPAELDAALAAMEPDGHGLTFLPLLAGERSPGWVSSAAGAVVGLREASRPLDLVRAAMEAVAVRLAAVVAALEGMLGPCTVIGSGGGVWHSIAWAQILADALGRDIARSAEPEASSRGAALLALEYLGALEDLEALPPPVGGVVVAQPGRRTAYQRLWERQQRLYALLSGEDFFVPAAAAAGAGCVGAHGTDPAPDDGEHAAKE